MSVLHISIYPVILMGSCLESSSRNSVRLDFCTIWFHIHVIYRLKKVNKLIDHNNNSINTWHDKQWRYRYKGTQLVNVTIDVSATYIYLPCNTHGIMSWKLIKEYNITSCGSLQRSSITFFWGFFFSIMWVFRLL
jgi:hypothetical protein